VGRNPDHDLKYYDDDLMEVEGLELRQAYCLNNENNQRMR
jgi:hypothetical protein